jgi:hypothetical protein
MSRLAFQLAALLSALSLAACGGTSAHSESRTETGALRITGGGSGQFREPGRDNTVESYGREGTRAELRQAAEEVHAYLVAQLEKEWSEACSHLSESLRSKLEEPLPTKPKGESCAKALRAIVVSLPHEQPREATEVDAGSLRIKGNFGFLFFNAATASPHKLLVFKEGGVWKPDGLLPTPVH